MDKISLCAMTAFIELRIESAELCCGTRLKTKSRKPPLFIRTRLVLWLRLNVLKYFNVIARIGCAFVVFHSHKPETEA